MNFKPKCSATAIGSFPHPDPDKICDAILANLPDIPIWPQLPNLGFRENMYIQFSEKLPCLVLDEEKERIFFQTSGDIYTQLEGFYEKFLTEDVDYFAISREYSAGFYVLQDKLGKEKPKSIKYLKGQVTGPVSFGLTVTDEKKRSILYHEELLDAVVKGCVMKARWQIKNLKSIHPEVIIFVDEPYLSSFGSAFINITREQVINYLNEVIEAIHGDHALAGVHCCGNTDWSILMDTQVDIINFDAYEYFEGMTLYPDHLRRFFDHGGVLAWGIVPTSDKVAGETTPKLINKFEDEIEIIRKKGFKQTELLEYCLITPSCGTGSMTKELADKVLRLTREVSKTLREKYFDAD